MRKSEFRRIVNNLQLLDGDVEALREYRNVPLQIKFRYLVDFLEDYVPEFCLFSRMLLRSLLMEDFDAAWNTMTNRSRKQQFLEKVKSMLLENTPSLVMRELAVNITLMILRCENVEEDIRLRFRESLWTLIELKDVKHQENGLLLFFTNEFRRIVNNLQLLTAGALREYKNISIGVKFRFLVDFLFDDDAPQFCLLSRILLRSLLMENFDAAWNTMDREEKLHFLEKVKLMLMDNSANFVMRQLAVHITSMILRSENLEENMRLRFLEFLVTLVKSEDVKHEENALLLFPLIAPVMKKKPWMLRSFTTGYFDKVRSENYDSFRDLLVFQCIQTANIFWRNREIERILRPFHLDDDLSNMTLHSQCCAQHGVIMTGIPKLDFVQMFVHADLVARGDQMDRKPYTLFRRCLAIMNRNMP